MGRPKWMSGFSIRALSPLAEQGRVLPQPPTDNALLQEQQCAVGLEHIGSCLLQAVLHALSAPTATALRHYAPRAHQVLLQV